MVILEFRRTIDISHKLPIETVVAKMLTLGSAEGPTPYMRTSWVACKLNDSSTLVYGARKTWTEAVARIKPSSREPIAMYLRQLVAVSVSSYRPNWFKS